MSNSSLFFTALLALGAGYYILRSMHSQNEKPVDGRVNTDKETLIRRNNDIEDVGLDEADEVLDEGNLEDEDEDEDEDHNVPNAQVRHVEMEEVPDEGNQYDNDDRPRRALEELQNREAQEGAKVNAWKNRGKVGAKKAKSLAKREQRRAYFEYVRQQAEEEKLHHQMTEEAFGDLLEEERKLREAWNEQARINLEEESKQRRAAEEQQREERRLRREEILAAVQTKGVFNLESEADIDICRDIPDTYILENNEFVVLVTEKAVSSIAEALEQRGELEFDSIVEILQRSY